MQQAIAGAVGLKNTTAKDRLLLLLLACTFTLAWAKHSPYEMSGFAMPNDDARSSTTDVPYFQSRFASSELEDFVHSPSITHLPDGGLMAAWFAGSREGGKDVVIRGSVYDPETGEWNSTRTLASRESTMAGVHRYIRKLGNPVLATAPDGRLWLFYVSVSVGGWAGSAINAKFSDDGGESWSEPRRLITSPFLNISTLVRTSPVFYSDGSIGLPVYHEFLGKFAELLYLDSDGHVIDKFRISGGDDMLQPTVVPQGQHRAVALMRYAGEPPYHVIASETTDGGRTWSEPKRIPPWNPNSSLAAVASHDRHDSVLVALNNLRDDRFRLSLYQTDSELQNWQKLMVLDQSPDPEGDAVDRQTYETILGNKFLNTASATKSRMLDEFLKTVDHRMCSRHGCEFQYEYPYFIRSPDGRFHIVYSWNNSLIKHVTFNNAWLETQR